MEILEVIFPVAALVFFGGTAYVVGKASKRWRKDFDEAMTELEEEHEGEVDSSILSGSTSHLDFSSPLSADSIEVGEFAR